jgi:hypothetical protein
MIIAKFRKNALEEIRVSLEEYEGRKLINFRVWMELPNGEFIPTRKGVAFSPSLFPKLKEAIEALEKSIKEEEKEK